MNTYQIKVYGEVQGVFFRATAKKKADELRLKGWVKNNADGHVEILVQGEDSRINEFIAWCKVGPSKAQVDKVDIEKKDSSPFRDFEIIRGR
jgi:acylphosphatase